MTYYLLKGKKPVPCNDPMTWSLKFWNSQDRFIAQTKVEQYFISTIFLGIDHGTDPDQPILFETMVFKEEDSLYSVRSQTFEEAERIHLEMCRLAKQDFSG